MPHSHEDYIEGPSRKAWSKWT